MAMTHLNRLWDLSRGEIEDILDQAMDLKQKWKVGQRPALLAGRMLTQLFDKPSLRTRVSFESAMVQLGGAATFLSSQEAGLQGRESLPDVARVLGSYSDAIVIRTFSQATVEEFCTHAGCPIINGLSDELHPCQALTDMLTLQEVFGTLRGPRLVYIGDGNNVAKSLVVATGLLEIPITVCSPPGYALEPEFMTDLLKHVPTADVTQIDDPHLAVRDADAIYTDVWASMGQEAEADARQRDFAPYQVNAQLMSSAPRSCRFMHCLPARRGLEVTDDVLEGPQSVVFQQAENRLHLAKGLLAWLLR